MEKSINITELQPEELAEHIGETVTLHGSIYKIRKMRGFCFCLLRTARQIVQCVCDRQELMTELEEEACVRLTVEVVKEERARTGVELHILGVQYLSRPVAPMPIVINKKKVDTSLENKLDFRPLTLRNEKERAIFRIQEGILKGCRRFFEEEHFTEIHTPKIVYAGAEGGANIFRLDYFGREAYLAQSPQFYKQMMAGVFERVYEVGPVFRAEKHDTARHLNEYTGVDFEMGYIESFRDIMAAEVRMLQWVMKVLSDAYAYELELLQVKLPDMAVESLGQDKALSGNGAWQETGVSGNGAWQETGVSGKEARQETGVSGKEARQETEVSGNGVRQETGVSGKEARQETGVSGKEGEERAVHFIEGNGTAAIPAIRFSEAKRLVAKERGCKSGECHDFEPEEEKLLSEIIRRKYGSDFVFITHYPEAKRPFYVMEDPENPGETLSFDLIFRGLEITTGGQRIHDYDMQLKKMERRGMRTEDFKSYLMIHEHGMPPHGGLGIGLERLTARLLGFENVRQACLFPRDIHRLEP